MAICFKFIIILGLIYNPAFNRNIFAATTKILIRSTDANQLEYSKYISENSDYTQPNLLNLSKLLFQHKSNQVLNLQKLAEIEFLEEDVTKSIETYKKIVSLALNDLWSSEVKQIIFQSYFRLAQLQKDKEEFWVQKAIDFAVDSKPDSKLTPMGLSELHTKLKNSNLNKEQEIIKFGPELSNKYLINSSVVNTFLNKKTIYRIDYVTEYSLPFTTYVSGSKIIDLKTSELKFKGLCDQLKPERRMNFTSSQIKQFSNFYVYSSNQCKPTPVKMILDKSILADNQALTEDFKSSSSNKTEIKDKESFGKASNLTKSLPLKTDIELYSDLNPTSNQNLSLVAQPDSNLKTKKQNKKSSGQKTWIYIGSAILAVTLGAVFINQQNDSPRTYEATSRQGF